MHSKMLQFHDEKMCMKYVIGVIEIADGINRTQHKFCIALEFGVWFVDFGRLNLCRIVNWQQLP